MYTSLVMALSVMGDSMLYAVLPSMLGEFGMTAGLAAGVILSTNRWIRMFSNSWAAKIYNKFGLKRPLMISLILALFSTASYGLFDGFWPLFVARIGWGICFSIQMVSMYMVILKENSDHRGMHMGVFNGVFRSGSAVAVLMGGILAESLGIKNAFLFTSSFVIICIPLVLLLRDHGEKRDNEQRDLTSIKRNGVTEGQETVTFKDRIWGFLLGSFSINSNLRLKILSVFFVHFTKRFLASGVTTATIGLIVKDQMTEPFSLGVLTIGAASLTGIILAMSWGSEVGFSAIFGFVSDKFGRKLMISISVPVIVLCTIIINVNLLVLLLAVPLLFAATTAAKVTLDASAGDLAPIGHQPEIMARYSTWGDVGSAVGPLLGYGLLTYFSIFAVYSFSALLLILAFLFYIVIFWNDRLNENEIIRV